MREILFRGKRLDNGEWVYGSYYVDLNGDDYIVPINWTLVCDSEIKVLHETLGQFTGLLDKNGNKIFEGDIVKHDNNEYEISFDKVGFDGSWNGLTGFALKRKDKFYSFNEIYYCDDPEDLEIIGNIHDNGELHREIKGEIK